MQVASKVIILAWDDMGRADQALKNLKKAQKDHILELDDAVVVVKNQEGKVQVKESEHLTTKRGVAFGGITGLVVGIMLGGLIGGALLGGAAGALTAKIDLGIPNDKIEIISESMAKATSAIFAQIKSGNEDIIAAAVRESGAKVIELSLSEEMEADLEETLNAAAASHQ
jgi:uncharacterized membrane protein